MMPLPHHASFAGLHYMNYFDSASMAVIAMTPIETLPITGRCQQTGGRNPYYSGVITMAITPFHSAVPIYAACYCARSLMLAAWLINHQTLSQHKSVITASRRNDKYAKK